RRWRGTTRRWLGYAGLSGLSPLSLSLPLLLFRLDRPRLSRMGVVRRMRGVSVPRNSMWKYPPRLRTRLFCLLLHLRRNDVPRWKV
ncbi:hypothetical protein PIB30_110994, partial [Stylosanthes scabra]|nr:hypothetical protein [Stylosanthes scabra]